MTQPQQPHQQAPRVAVFRNECGQLVFDCPHCGKAHAIPKCRPAVTGCETVIGNVQLIYEAPR